MSGHMGRALRIVCGMIWPLLVYELIGKCAEAAYRLKYGTSAPDDKALVLTGASALAAVLFLGALYLLLRGQGRIGCARPRRDFRMVCLSALAGLGSCIFVNHIIGFFSFRKGGFDGAAALLYGPPFFVQILCTGLLIPLAEELIFRGLIFGRLRREMKFFPAAVLSAAYFGIFHGNLPQGIYALCLGLILAMIYEWSGSVMSAWAFHAAANLLSVFLMAAHAGEWAGGRPAARLLFALAGGMILMASLYKMREVGKRNEITVDSNTML